MSIRTKFLEAREKPLMDAARNDVERGLEKFVASLPDLMEKEINKALTGNTVVGNISINIDCSYEKMTVAQLVELPFYQALHRLCSSPDIDVCVKTDLRTTGAGGGYDAERYFSFTVSLAEPYTKSNHIPPQPLPQSASPTGPVRAIK